MSATVEMNENCPQNIFYKRTIKLISASYKAETANNGEPLINKIYFRS